MPPDFLGTGYGVTQKANANSTCSGDAVSNSALGRVLLLDAQGTLCSLTPWQAVLDVTSMQH